MKKVASILKIRKTREVNHFFFFSFFKKFDQMSRVGSRGCGICDAGLKRNRGTYIPSNVRHIKERKKETHVSDWVCDLLWLCYLQWVRNSKILQEFFQSIIFSKGKNSTICQILVHTKSSYCISCDLCEINSHLMQ